MKIFLIFFLLYGFSSRWPHPWSCTMVENMNSWNSEKSSFLDRKPRKSFLWAREQLGEDRKSWREESWKGDPIILCGNFHTSWLTLEQAYTGKTQGAQCLSSEPKWVDCLLKPKIFPRKFQQDPESIQSGIHNSLTRTEPGKCDQRKKARDIGLKITQMWNFKCKSSNYDMLQEFKINTWNEWKDRLFSRKTNYKKEPHGNFIAKSTEVKNPCMGNEKIEMTANRIKDKLINVQF